MRDMKYTDGLWEYNADGVYPEIVAREANGALLSVICDWDDREGCLQPPSNADGFRIVACVNACEGIPTDALQGNSAMVMKPPNVEKAND